MKKLLPLQRRILKNLIMLFMFMRLLRYIYKNTKSKTEFRKDVVIIEKTIAGKRLVIGKRGVFGITSDNANLLIIKYKQS